ncbi:MAG: polysaccharide biosynthesis protein [Ruminococcus sp.]|nr:polysaccharide biosynthesis protein [Ruminococcus sp.]
MKNRDHKNNLLSSAVVYTVGLVLIRGLGFISAPIFTNLLTPADYGITSTFATWTLLMQTVFSLYTQGSLVAALKDYKGKEYERYVSSVLTLSSVCFLLFSVLFLGNLGWMSRLLGYTRFISILLIISAYVSFIFNFYQVKLIYEGKDIPYIISSFLVSLSSIVVSYVLIRILPEDMAVDGRLIGGIVPLFVITVGYLVVQYRRGRCFYSKEFWKYAVELSIPMIFTTLANVFLAQIARLMLQHLTGEHEAGIYSFAYTLGEVPSFIRLGIFNAWLPWYFRMVSNEKNIPDIIEMVRALSRLFCIIILGFIFVSPEVYRILSPESYWEGIPILMYIAAGMYFYFITCFYSVRFQYDKKNKWISYITMFSAVVNVILNFVLIPSYGFIGAAVVSMVVYVVLYIAYLFLGRKNNSMDGITGEIFRVDIVLLTVGCGVYYVLGDHAGIRWIIGVALGIYFIYYLLNTRPLFKSLQSKEKKSE